MTAVGISTLEQRLGSSAVIVIGIAGVVGVLVALLAMGEGYSEELRKTGSEDTAIVMRGASDSEVTSVLDRDSVVVIQQAKGIARDAQGKPIASPELVVAANLPLAGGGPTISAASSCAASARRPGRCGRRSRSSPAASSVRACAN